MLWDISDALEFEAEGRARRLPHRSWSEGGVDLFVELVDDFGRRGFRCADAEPEARLISRHKLTGCFLQPNSFEMRCAVPVPMPSDLATFKIPTPFASSLRTFRSVTRSIFGRPSW